MCTYTPLYVCACQHTCTSETIEVFLPPLCCCFEKQLLHKQMEEEKQVAVKEVVTGHQQDFQSKYPRLAASFGSMAGMSTVYPNGSSFLKEKMSLIATDKAEMLEEKWKKLEDDEAALMVKRLDLIAEHFKLVVDAMRGN
ncbi:STOREKEEPER protein-like [Solanum pennellii]|uniref:STOREKEEPER protein-like n=1 Tax=Solanum pennellii TaxID=28526 RepID=A0ABM1H503_SOLPN|nr:STOREKEEPER protein-like [Solanum pennellii]XP_015080434.1 STOREKEEPER protein-like [Solanum pennellii]XP_015080435.1 STOREKEEPER protein-like [Solanum pennellii]XP_015080436.1 STOREKEEPER protein-like [Solanum pennellii]